MSKDIGSGALLLVIAAVYYWATLQIPSSSLSDDVGAHGMPTLLAAGLAVIACMILGRALLASRRAAPAANSIADNTVDEEERYEAPLPRALGLIAIGGLYIVVAIFLGYIPALAVLIFVTALYEGLAVGWQPAAVALGGAAAFWLLFVKLLGTEQPIGLALGFLAGL